MGTEQNAFLESEKKENVSGQQNESFFTYYVFVGLSAVIGFVTVFFIARFFITNHNSKELLSGIASDKVIMPSIIAIVAVIIFMFLSLVFKKFFKQIFFSEVFLYLYMGVLTTIVNIISFEVIRNMIVNANNENSIGWKIAEILAFLIAVIFAFVTNKYIVFKKCDINIMNFFTELGKFFGVRVVTEIINFIMMFVMIDIMKIGELNTKITASIVVIILNYIFSKFIVFKKDAEKAQ